MKLVGNAIGNVDVESLQATGTKDKELKGCLGIPCLAVLSSCVEWLKQGKFGEESPVF